MNYAEVAVNAPVRSPRTFSYSIPEGMTVEVGQGVWVPFGARTLQGIVCQVTGVPAFEQTRNLVSTIDRQPLLAPWQVELARWVSDYYFCPVFAACALMLPPGFERKLITSVQRLDVSPGFSPSLSPDQQMVLAAVGVDGTTPVKEMEKEFGRKLVRQAVQALVRKGLFHRLDALEKERIRPKKIKVISLAITGAEAAGVIESWQKEGKHAAGTAVLKTLLQEKRPLTLSEIKAGLAAQTGYEKQEATGGKTANPASRLPLPASNLSLGALQKLGMISVEEKTVRRDPLESYRTAPSPPPVLTPYQDAAFRQLEKALDEKRPATFLLHGVTGSGKTEIYLRAAGRVAAMGKKAIVLVPEIALTPQTISRFMGRFPGRVAVLHSKLSAGEQYDEWWRIKNGECDVVIGSRSAVFSPQADPGLIVIDEEHEWTYKQKENRPLYHARDVALKIAELTGATVVLGSATPDLGSYHSVESGRYRLLSLPERVSTSGGSSLPPVDIVDMRQELLAGNRGLFSRSLVREVRQALRDRAQVILFLNRRGANSFIQCRDCGYVARCRRCEVSLVYHRDQERLICHQCNWKVRLPEQCPQCRSPKIKFLGAGTQRVEDEAALNFEGARLLRWDRDATREKHSHERILRQFSDHEADILIGTQMVAKGLDIPAVTLVGVVNADVGLFLPDFRSAERTFQILTQVAGRAGRGPKGGKVIIQTYNPSHYAIVAASQHDYRAFYRRELGYRRELNYPPCGRMVCLSYQRTSENACKVEAERVAGLIADEAARGIFDVQVLGPTPAFIARKRGRYEWQMILKGKDCHGILSGLALPSGWTVDVDPVGLG